MEKVITLKKLLRELKGRGKKVVFTNGCFDIIHAGHVRYLKKAKALGDMLIIGLNSDSSVRKIKGEGRPIVNQKDRAEVLSSLAPVDYVVIFGGPTPIKLVEAIRPDILVKGADWKKGEIVGEGLVRSYGGRVSRIKLARGRSTTDIIRRIIRLHKR
ncbi:MAG: D-glycero-beta-D-manno-heptose 1-phosphate adenylyltransferase [Deltaproteobacteria bacterium]|nr:D-glycero-beta-D-manno-heptose 1-phosphate adenylyltransferase [Deltaproteobacteria bacterium]